MWEGSVTKRRECLCDVKVSTELSRVSHVTKIKLSLSILYFITQKRFPQPPLQLSFSLHPRRRRSNRRVVILGWYIRFDGNHQCVCA